jgi:hypothetical protein
MSLETNTLELAATESGDWWFHCHILYHLISGMGRLFSYEGSAVNPGYYDFILVVFFRRYFVCL